MTKSIAAVGAGFSAAPGACLLCHTVDNTVTQSGLDTGAYWRCQRCGQTWDAQRLAAATAYAQTLSPAEVF